MSLLLCFFFPALCSKEGYKKMIGSTLSRLGCVLIGHVYPVSDRCSDEHISHMLLKGPLAIWGSPMPLWAWINSLQLAHSILRHGESSHVHRACLVIYLLFLLCGMFIFCISAWVCGCAGGRGEQVYRTFKATTYKIQADDDQDLSEPCALDYAQLNDLRRILSYWAVMGYTDRTPTLNHHILLR